MNSTSYTLLQIAGTMLDETGCCSLADFLNTEEEQNDAIPLKIQKHLALYLSFISSPPISHQALIEKFNASPYVNQKRKILQRSTLPPISSRPSSQDYETTRPQCQFDRLPPELLCQIALSLSPADLVSLNLTSRSLFQRINYQLVDLLNLGFGSDLSDTLYDHGLYAALAKQRYEVRRRLDRDRLAQLGMVQHCGYRACSVCIKLHPIRYFGEGEGDGRCLASLAKWRICEHWNEDLVGLRGWRERSLCEQSTRDQVSSRAKVCPHRDHEEEERRGGFGPPTVMDVGSFWSVERSVWLREFERGEEVGREIVEEILRSDRLRGLEVCQHVKLGDEVVTGAFDQRLDLESLDCPAPLRTAMERSIQFRSSACPTCGTEWQFSFSKDNGEGEEPHPFILKLIVEKTFPSVRNPWIAEYLKGVEEGEELMQLMGDRADI